MREKQYSTVQYSTVQYSSVQYNTVQYCTFHPTFQNLSIDSEHSTKDQGHLPGLKLSLVNIYSQWHHRAAHVEVVGEGEDGDEQLPYLEGHVVEQLHGLLLKVPGTALGVQDFTDVLNGRSFIKSIIKLNYRRNHFVCFANTNL